MLISSHLLVPSEVLTLLFGAASESEGHSRRVAELSFRFALLSGECVPGEAYLAGLLHDLGKQEVSPGVLDKRGALDDHDWTEIRSHPARGAELLHRWWPGCPEQIALCVRDHHEREDGSGYPAGRAGLLAPMTAIVAVADVFDALVSARAYRSRSYSYPEALEILDAQALPVRFKRLLRGLVRDAV